MISISFDWAYMYATLLVIIRRPSNLGPISHHFPDTATYSLKLFIKNCGQTAADGDTVTIVSL